MVIAAAGEEQPLVVAAGAVVAAAPLAWLALAALDAADVERRQVHWWRRVAAVVEGVPVPGEAHCVRWSVGHACGGGCARGRGGDGGGDGDVVWIARVK